MSAISWTSSIDCSWDRAAAASRAGRWPRPCASDQRPKGGDARAARGAIAPATRARSAKAEAPKTAADPGAALTQEAMRHAQALAESASRELQRLRQAAKSVTCFLSKPWPRNRDPNFFLRSCWLIVRPLSRFTLAIALHVTQRLHLVTGRAHELIGFSRIQRVRR